MANGNDLQTIAYVSFTSLTNFVKKLNETAIPPVIDGSVLAYTSGSAASQIKTALRFLGLTDVTDGKDQVTQRLRDLVAAYGKKEEWKACWEEIIGTVYAPIIGDLEIKEATQQQLNDALRVKAGSASGSVDKAARFYLAALDEADIEYSPYFKTPKKASGSTGTTTKKRRRRKKQTHDEGESGDDSAPPEDWQRFELPIKSAQGKVRIDLPEAMRRPEWNYIKTTIEGYFGLVWSEEETE